MLGKLLKYEFRATSRLLLPLIICMLIVGIAGGAIANFQARIIESESPGVFDRFFKDAEEFFGFFDRNNENQFYEDGDELPDSDWYGEDDSDFDEAEPGFAAQTSSRQSSSDWKGILVSVTMMFLCLVLFGLACCSVVSLILLAYRFYKNMFTDEGYLTFTLPVSVSQNLCAKLIVGSVWQAAVSLISVLSIAMLFIGGVGVNLFENMKNLSSFLGDFFGIFMQIPEFSNGVTVLLIVEWIVEFILGIPAGLLILYLAVTLGCQAAKRYKVAASIGMFFIIGIVHSILSYFIQLIFALPVSAFVNDNPALLLAVNMLPGILLSMISIAVCFLWCRHIMKNKLNLE